ncbi:hypothetical protein NDU88_010973 [Pleurodeles waltl]|uniref:Uncharacterized protein n=1 Tax=Pleurodeles waltl TaxID=8319 RepID=A0AAV7S263_PLEWA|nr:hypothetical protein NDU88_010973 [Pleurodeles waltl]
MVPATGACVGWLPVEPACSPARWSPGELCVGSCSFRWSPPVGWHGALAGGALLCAGWPVEPFCAPAGRWSPPVRRHGALAGGALLCAGTGRWPVEPSCAPIRCAGRWSAALGAVRSAPQLAGSPLRTQCAVGAAASSLVRLCVLQEGRAARPTPCRHGQTQLWFHPTGAALALINPGGSPDAPFKKH